MECRSAVLAVDPSLRLEGIAGFEQLSGAEQAELREGEAAPPQAAALPDVESTPAQTAALKEEEAELAQPAKGAVTRSKGKVCWRFAGHLCYGTLLPAHETKTHCYARTHKGNTKTLTKGGTSSWLLE